MLFAKIRELQAGSPEGFAQGIWKDALERSGPHAFRRFLHANPQDAAHFLDSLQLSFSLWEVRAKGLVYVCTHPAFPGMVKIGSTLNEAVQPRLKGLRSAGVVGQHTAVGVVPHFNARGLEASMHREFRPMRVEREWFKAPTDLVLTRLTRAAQAEVELRAALLAPLATPAELSLRDSYIS